MRLFLSATGFTLLAVMCLGANCTPDQTQTAKNVAKDLISAADVACLLTNATTADQTALDICRIENQYRNVAVGVLAKARENAPITARMCGEAKLCPSAQTWSTKACSCVAP